MGLDGMFGEEEQPKKKSKRAGKSKPAPKVEDEEEDFGSFWDEVEELK